MRKISKRNKISFNIFAVVIVIVIALLSFAVVRVMAQEKEEYQIAKQTTIYDKDQNLIDTVSDGTITKKWTGEYHLSLDNGSYNLGKYNVISTNTKLSVLGNAYQVFTDGSVATLSRMTQLNNNEIMFFKLADRRYLFVGKSITSTDKSIQASRYLEVVMDKTGSALLLNDDMNKKTIDPLVLSCGDLTFDVANEKLTYQTQKVDLKAINGSTNEYQPPIEEDTDVPKDNQQSQNPSTNQGTQNTVTNDQTNNSNTSGNISSIVNGSTSNKKPSDDSNTNKPNQGGSNGSTNGGNNNGGNNNGGNNNGGNNNGGNNNGGNNNGGNNNGGNNNGGNNNGGNTGGGSNGGTTGGGSNTGDTNKPTDRYIALRGTTATINTITVNYSIMDVENKYVATYLILEDLENDEETRIGINKADSTITLRSLTPNTQYKISLGYDRYVLDKDKNSVLTEEIAGVVTTRTKNITASININRITATKIYYTVKADADFVLDEATVVLYIDDSKEAQKALDVKKASKDGFSSSFDIRSGTTYKITLENCVYQGDEVQIHAQCTSVVSNTVSSFIDKLLGWFR